MGTTLYYQASDPPSTSYMSDETYLDDSNQIYPNNVDHPVHLFVFISIWIVLLVAIIFGTIGNILVLYVYINRKDNKTCTFFIKMLAIVDLIICLILAPLELYQVTTGIRNEFLCKSYGFLSTHVLYSTLLITIIAFDRYFCICWPLYKIITIRRAHAIVIICGLLSSLLAIVPMREFSTTEHVFQIHHNHSEHFSVKSSEENDLPSYKHVEHMKMASILPFTLNNATKVHCSPEFSLQLRSPKFVNTYRIFHSALFAICILLVLILYAFIYNAVYQRRVTRTRKLSAYRRIIRSYLLNNQTDQTGSSSLKKTRAHYHRSPSTLTLICCYCCKTSDEYNNELQRPSEAALNVPLHERHRQPRHLHKNEEPSSMMMNQNRNKPRVVLEVNGARGKRFSTISMTSMTYLTSGVWDETTSTNLIRSRINSIAATTYCGTEHSSTSRPSTSTEDSFEQASKLSILNNTLSQSRPMTPSNVTHLTVPGQPSTVLTLPTPSTIEVTNKDQYLNGNNLPRSVSQCTNTQHPSIVRKQSNTLSIRQQQRSSDVSSIQPRKVSFMTSSGIVDRCPSEDISNNYQRTNLTPSIPSSYCNQPQHQLAVHIDKQRTLSTTSSIDHPHSSIRNLSISSTRRPSTFDCETQRTLERQQTQERLANIRTTLTLFVVTATFIVMYLPSIIHILFNIKPHTFREVLFLLCYINSACNPLIYSFFNVNFRNDIRRIYECQKREYLARRY